MIEVDLGIILTGFVFSTIGSIIQFWQTITQIELKNVNKGLSDLIDEVKIDGSRSNDIKQLVTGDKKQGRKLVRLFLTKKRKEIRSKHLVNWSITIFFGFIAGMIYLLITEFVLQTSFVFGALAAGYSGESFVLSVLKQEDLFEEINIDELIGFREA